MFRREQGRPFHADERNNIRRIRPQPPQFRPRQRFETYDAPYLEEIPTGPIRPRRRMPMPQYYEEEPAPHTEHYRPYQSSEPDTGPKPLLDAETIERLRANINMVSEKLNQFENHYRNECKNARRPRYEDQYQEQYEERNDDRYDDRYDDHCEYRFEEPCDRDPEPPCPGPSSVHREMHNPNEYIHEEEEATKKTIEEIIMVAQALREKLEHREEREEPVLERREEHFVEYRDPPEFQRAPEYQSPIEFYEHGCEPLPPYPRRRPPLLKTPNIKPIPQIAPETGASNGKIPSLLEIKTTKIPSLLEIQVEPPEAEFVQENFEPPSRYPGPRTRDICWNCNKIGHRHEMCWFPPKEFCYRCGTQGVNDETCPTCCPQA